MFTGMLHTHSAAWIIMIILFLVSYFVPKQKVKKVTHMILRLFYLIQLFSGGYMFFQGGYPHVFDLKIVLAIILIGMMEMILVRQRKGKNTLPFWIIFGVLLVVIVLIGYGVITFG
ncbi:MAG: DUF1516 family protein [Candidatus Pristimantibacillus lignocellulolyticus]|uniref:DUF1516 family protein n=1 Tax=Candidatus Pristimantibacillus lignocellulolyticus TaxID=2994561 RepID=A0A9J6ZGY3_9BACL|nr:MAG: DUF1516 family protein [Candidatus Pristimantibacillus lignocellulolyticus]